MYHGEIVALIPADRATRRRLGLLMAGSTEEGAEDKIVTTEAEVA